MHKLFAAIAVMAAIMVLATLMPLGAGQTPQVGGGEQFKVPVTAPVQNAVNPPPLPNTQPPQSSLPSNYLPTSPPFLNPPTLPTTGPDKASGQTRVMPNGFPDPMANFLQGPVQYTSDGLMRPGADGEKNSAIREFLNHNFDAPDLNKDISIDPRFGPWAICLQWYNGKDAAQMARDMVFELRKNPAYNLASACVWRVGVDECKAEQKRLWEVLEKNQKQREEALKANMPTIPARVPVVPSIEIQYAVLVGGYKDMESARRDLERLKKLPPPDPNRVKLHTKFAVTYDEKGMPKQGQYAPINPFLSATVVPNLSLPKAQATGFSADYIAELKRLNADESFSLLKCPKKFTLKVKEYSMPGVIQAGNNSSSMVPKLSLGIFSKKEDTAAQSAHNLAVLLSQAKCEAYVLHDKYCSYVCVGSYDGKDDARLKHDQEMLPKLLPQINRELADAVRMSAAPPPMLVPR